MALRRLARASGVISLSNGVSIAAQIFKNKALAILVGPAGMGLIGQASFLQTLLWSASNFGMTNGVFQALSRRRNSPEEFRRVADLGSRFLIWSTAILAFAAFLAAAPLSAFIFASPGHRSWVCAVLVCLLFSWVGGVSEHVLIADARLGPFTLCRIIAYSGAAAGTVAGAWLYGTAGAIWGASAAMIVSYAVTWGISYSRTGLPRLTRQSLLWSRARWPAEKPIYREVAGVGLVNGATGVMNLGAYFLLRSLALRSLGETSLGLYHSVYIIAAAVSPIVANGIWGHYYPAVSAEQDPAKIAALTNDAVRFCIVGIFPVYLLILLTGKWFIPVFLSKRFLPGLPWLPWQMAVECLGQVNLVFYHLFLARYRLRLYLAFGFSQALVLLAAGIFSVKAYGIGGLIGAHLFSMLTQLVLAAYLAARCLGIGIERRLWFWLAAGVLGLIALPRLFPGLCYTGL